MSQIVQNPIKYFKKFGLYPKDMKNDKNYKKEMEGKELLRIELQLLGL